MISSIQLEMSLMVGLRKNYSWANQIEFIGQNLLDFEQSKSL